MAPLDFDPQRIRTNQLTLAQQAAIDVHKEQGVRADAAAGRAERREAFTEAHGQTMEQIAQSREDRIADREAATAGLAARREDRAEGHQIAAAKLYHGRVPSEDGKTRDVTVRMGPAGGWIDVETNQPVKGLTGIRGVGTTDAGDPNDPAAKSTAQAIASYQLPPMTGYALRAPGAREVMAEVMALNPSYQATRYPEISKAMRDFGSGTEAK